MLLLLARLFDVRATAIGISAAVVAPVAAMPENRMANIELKQSATTINNDYFAIVPFLEW